MLSWILNLKLDSIPFVDSIVSRYLFTPPKTQEDEILSLGKIEGNKLFFIEDISVLEITPKISLLDKIVIFSHGNSTDIHNFYSYLDWFSNQFGIKIVCYDYPGYGLTTGYPSEENCYRSASLVISHYLELYDQKKIILMARSLGTGIIVDYCAKNGWTNSIILISPYKSIVRCVFDWTISDSLLGHNNFCTIDKLNDVMCPVKIFHGTNDDIVPVSHGMNIYENIKNKKFAPVWVDGADHRIVIQVMSDEDIIEVLNS